MEKIQNNKVSVIGKIVSGFTFSHEVLGEGFYLVDLEVKRLSGKVDILPLMVSEYLLDIVEDYAGCMVEVDGQFRSHNHCEENRNRVILSVFVRNINFVEEISDDTKNNQIFLDGYVCKMPVYRRTHFGREVSDLLLAVNRPYGKTDYIPCIAKDRKARYAADLKVGTRVQIWGLIRSREYIKRIGDSEYEQRVAYEVAINRIEV